MTNQNQCCGVPRTATIRSRKNPEPVWRCSVCHKTKELRGLPPLTRTQMLNRWREQWLRQQPPPPIDQQVTGV